MTLSFCLVLATAMAVRGTCGSNDSAGQPTAVILSGGPRQTIFAPTEVESRGSRIDVRALQYQSFFEGLPLGERPGAS